MGLYLEASTNQRTAVPGEKVNLRLEISNRSNVEFKVRRIHYMPTQFDSLLNKKVRNNESYVLSDSIEIPKDIPYNTMYWLNDKASLGMFHVPNPLLRGLPESPRYLKTLFECEVEGVPILFSRDMVFKMNDRKDGEVFKPFDIVPELSLSFADKVHLFGDSRPKDINVIVKSNKNDLNTDVSLEIPEGWRSEPEKYNVDISLKGDEKEITFKLFPPETQSSVDIQASATVGSKKYEDSHTEIEYDHIPLQNIVRKAQARAVRIDIKTVGDRIAYIDGTGDLVPESLTQIGFSVERIAEEAIIAENLLQYDAVIIGIRAYNTKNILKV